MQTQNLKTLSQYNEFPAYPTSFIIAADTEIEVSLARCYNYDMH
jgi:hypothetical protein